MLRFIIIREYNNYTDDEQKADELQVYNEASYEIEMTCDNLQDFIVNASTFLSSSYENSGQGIYTFLWLEFFGTQYRILNISVKEADKRVLDDKPIIASGSIREIFGCKSSVQPTSSTIWSTVLISSIIIVVLIALCVWITCFTNVEPPVQHQQKRSSVRSVTRLPDRAQEDPSVSSQQETS